MLYRFGTNGALAPLRSPNYRRFFIGQLISVAGTWLQIVAEGWLVYQLTHSTAWLGIVAGAGALPGLLLGLWGGQVADRYPRRRILMVCQAAYMTLALALARIDAAPPAFDPTARPSPLEGLRYVRQDSVAFRVLALFAVTACFGWSYQTLLPAIAHERFGRGADGMGALMAAAGVGSFIAALVTAAASGERHRRHLLYGGAFGYAGA